MAEQHRQIRAVYDDETITVYQAYNESIANAAVQQQRLSASPLFLTRRTWIKPSWNWMMYRSGYSYKDANQSNILALKIKRSFFEKLLMAAVLTNAKDVKRDEMTVSVQWDPERNVRIGRLDEGTKGVRGSGAPGVRSIQIGIPAMRNQDWLDEGIVGIEDVTWRARELKRVLDDSRENKTSLSEKDLVKMGLIPEEKIYVLPEEVAKVVGITGG
ncbi:hypothetical protein H2198_003369 [Neophaeococcomyces mojaviensis]|uniref:Uncharacterized protein n=1 Tax=Neophaeococcomyces mojaviensis TaxID=3383035 RepID=A0ACC3AC42_9EURO|nr:hypothetical protein H2198_003369 [Knufia sp. JES_112]